MSSAARGGYAPGGGGRQVQDRNYFLAELRAKAREVQQTVESMQADLAGADMGQEADLERARSTARRTWTTPSPLMIPFSRSYPYLIAPLLPHTRT